MRSRSFATIGLIVAIGAFVLASGEASAQMQGVPGAMNPRMGGRSGMAGMGSGTPRPMTGSSVPMMGRQGPVRSGQSLNAAAAPTSRYSGAFGSNMAKAQAQGWTANRTSEAYKSQAKTVGGGIFGYGGARAR